MKNRGKYSIIKALPIPYPGIKVPHWYVRYGMNDRDSSFALETLLRYSIFDCEAITDHSFEFAWLMGHAGDYDVSEAYAWLDEALAQNE